MTTTVKKTKTQTKAALFPSQDVELLLRDELMEAAEVEADIQGVKLPASAAAASIAPLRLDSLAVVDLLCALEPVLGFAPKDAAVQTGGYGSVQDAIDHLMPRLEAQWYKHQRKRA